KSASVRAATGGGVFSARMAARAAWFHRRTGSGGVRGVPAGGCASARAAGTGDRKNKTVRIPAPPTPVRLDRVVVLVRSFRWGRSGVAGRVWGPVWASTCAGRAEFAGKAVLWLSQTRRAGGITLLRHFANPGEWRPVRCARNAKVTAASRP